MLSKFENIGIKAISACLPQKRVSIAEYAPDLITTPKEAKRFTRSTGFANLAVTNAETTADLCYQATLKIFAETEYKPKDIDALLFVTQTPNWELPATSHYLQDKLGLSQNIVCFDINEGCSGYEQGLYLAATLIASEQCRNVLLLAGDTISKITDPQDRATRLIFGDAGTASIISASDTDMYFHINTYGDRYKAILSDKVRVHQNEYEWGGHLHLEGMDIMNFTLNDVPENINALLNFCGWSKDEISLYACHQANKLILMSLADKLGVSHEKLPFVAENIGNTSSASIPLMFSCGVENGLNRVLLCGFGVGLACASCVADLSKTKILDVVNYVND